ncbi:MAG TPA: hypothetical protein VMM92_16050 [Thermoanaerobaculia bacterium]|nr:hypothetical protein [Thermoanaerobaculia bacterium]
MHYDDAAWHYKGDFPAGLPPEHGATHIGMFLGWAILRDLVGDLHRQDPDAAFDLERVRDRHLRPRDFLLNWCDEKLTEADLNAEGNAFASAYYQEHYLIDWATLFPENYRVDDSWENFDHLVELLDERYAAWQSGALRPTLAASR